MLPKLMCIAFTGVMIIFMAMHAWLVYYNVTSFEVSISRASSVCHSLSGGGSWPTFVTLALVPGGLLASAGCIIKDTMATFVR